MNFIGINNTDFGNLIFGSGSATGIYTNSIIFQRDFIPTDLPYLFSWYSSDYGVYQTYTGIPSQENDLIALWENKINNGTNLSHGNPSFQPRYINNAVKFSGINILTGNINILNSPLNYYVATQTILSGNNSINPAAIIKQGPSDISTQTRYTFTVNTGSKLGVKNATTSTISNITMSGGKNIIYAIFSGSTSQILGRGNNFQSLSATMNTSSLTNMIIGSHNLAAATSPLYGSIYEILIYTGSVHAETERNKIIKYLSNKWGVSN